LRLWELITPSSNLRLGWSLKQTCRSPQELSNGVSHSTCTHRGRVHSWLLVVESQTASLTPGPSFDHNLCCRCPNGSCKAIFYIYTSKPFQQCKEHFKARCFDPCNRTLKFWESRRTPSSHFWECEFHPHTCLKVGLRQNPSRNLGVRQVDLNSIILMDKGDRFLDKGGQIQFHYWLKVITTSIGVDKFGRSMDTCKYIVIEFQL
jgi:hypothetical protein